MKVAPLVDARRLILSALLLAASPQARAASAAWNVDANGSWSTAGSWNPAAAPGSTSTTNSTDTATFNKALTASRTVTVDANRNIGNLTFNGTADFGYTLSGGSLRLTSGGVILATGGTTAHTDTISTAIAIQGDGGTATFTDSSTAIDLNIGAVTGVSTGSNTTVLTLSGTSTGASVVSGIIGNGASGGKLALTKSDTGTWTLTGVNTYTGNTTVNAGTLQISGAGSLGSGNYSAGITNNGTFQYGSSANQTLSGIIGGTGALVKGTSSSSVLTLNGTAVNTYIGTTSVNAGTLLLDFANLATPTDLVNSGSALSLGGGTLNIKGKSTGSTSQSFAGTTLNAGGGSSVLGNVNGGTATTINLGALTTTAAGGSLLVGTAAANTTGLTITSTTNKDATGIYGGRVVFFNGTANTGYDWATTASGSSPYTLSAYSGYSALGLNGTDTNNSRITASTTLNGARTTNTLKIENPAASQTLALGTNLLTLTAGGILSTGTNAVTINGTAGATRLTAGNGSGSYDLLVHQYNSGGLSITAVIGDNGASPVNLVKAGTGNLTLNATNTYTGATYVNTGILNIQNATALGTTAGGVVVANGAALELQGDIAVGSEALQISGTGISSGGALKNVSGNNTWGGNIAVVGSGTNSIGSSGGTLTINGNISVQDGSTLNLVRPGSTMNTTINGIISGNNITLSLWQASSSNIVALNGANTYSGNTTTSVSGSNVLTLGNNLAFGTSTVTLAVNNGALFLQADPTRNGGNPVVIANPYTLSNGAAGRTFTLQGANDLEFSGNQTGGVAQEWGVTGTGVLKLSGVISASSSVIKVGNGTMVLSGANTYTGNTTIQNGILSINSIKDVGNATATALGMPTTAANGIIAFGANTTTGQLTYTGTGDTSNRTINLAGTTGGATIDQSGTGLLKFTSNLTATGVGAKTLTLQGSTAGTGEISGAIVNGNGTTSLAKSGNGTWTLSGANTYTGTTTISAGALVFQNKASRTGGSSVSATATGTVGLGVGGGGVSDYSDADVASLFNSTLSGFTLNAASGVAIDTTAGSFTQSTALTAARALTKLGNNTLTLSGANTYTGATTVSAGTLSTSAADRISDSSAVTVASGATFQIGGSETVGSIAGAGNYSIVGFTLTAGGDNTSTTVSGNITGASGALTKTGSGTLTLNGTNTYTGTTTINAGTLTISGGAAIADGGTVTLANTAGVTFNVNASETIASLQGGGATGGNVTIASAQTLTVAEANNNTFSGSLQGSGNFTKSGIGTLTLNGTNTNSGAVSVTGGTVLLSGASALSGSTSLLSAASSTTISLADGVGRTITLSGGNLSLSSATMVFELGSTSDRLTLTSGAVTLNGTNTISLANLGNFTAGTYTLISAASGLDTGGTWSLNTSGGPTGFSFSLSSSATTLTLNATASVNNFYWTGNASANWSGNNFSATDGGASTLSGSNLSANSDLIFAAAGASNLSTVLDSNYTAKSLAITSPGVSIGGANTLTVNSTSSSAIAVSASSGNTTISANLAGASAGLTKTNSGTLILSGSNTYNGTTTVSGGVLNIQHANSLGSTANGTTVATGAALQLQGGITVGAEALSLSGTGVSGDGALRNISGNNIYGGAITLATTTRINSDSGLLTLSGGISGTQDLTVGGAGNTTISNTIATSTGTLTKDGAGTLTLSGNNTYTGATTINAGTLALSGNLSGSNVVVNGASAVFNQTSTGGISGTGTTFTITSGNASLAGTNTYTGATTINAGTLEIASTGRLGAGSYAQNITNNGAFLYSGTNNQTLSGVISGSGALTQNNSSSTLTLSGNNTYTGTTTINAGTLEIASTGRLGGGSYAQNITNNGAFLYSGTNNQTLSGVISGAGALTQNGSGTLTLTGANTYTGNTTVQGNSILNIQNATALGTTAGGVVVANGAALELQGDIAVGSEALQISGTGISSGGALRNISGNNTWGGNIAVVGSGTNSIGSSGGTLTINGNISVQDGSTLNLVRPSSTMNTTINGNISGNNITLRLWQDAANNNVVLNGANTYSGNTTMFQSSSNVLTLGNNLAFGTSTVELAVNNGGALFLQADPTRNGGNPVVIANPYTLSNVAAGRVFTLQGANDLEFSGNQTVATAQEWGVTGTGVLKLSGVISTTSSVTKVGNGTMVLSGANTYTGATTIQNGILSINSIKDVGNATASALGKPTTAANGIIAFGANTTTGQLTYTGTGDTSNRTINLAGTTGGATIDQSGTGLLKFTSNLTATGVGAKTLTLQGSTAGTGEISGAIVDGNGTTSLAKSGNGTWTLSGANTYTGGTTISAGNISISTSTALGSTSGINLGNATALIYTGSAATLDRAIAVTSGTGTIQNTGSGLLTLSGSLTKNATTLTLKGGSNGITVSGAIGGSSANSDLVIDGGTVNLTGTNTYNGPTFLVNGATLNANVANAIPTANGRSAVSIDSTGTGSSTLVLGNSQSVASLTGAASSNVTLGSNTLTIGNASGSSTYAGRITGSGALVKDGANTQVLSGTNTYTGGTTISAGNLTITGGSALADTGTVTLSNTSGAVLTISTSETIGSLSGGGAGGGNVVIASAQTLTVNQTTNTTFSGAISGANLVKTGSGTLTMNGSNTYTGTTTISSGTLTAAAAGATGNSTVINVTGGSFLVTAENAVNDNTAINLGGGCMAVSGTFNETVGALTLSANSTLDFSGFVGTLRFSGIGSWAAGANLAIWNWSGTTYWGTQVNNYANPSNLVFSNNSTLTSNLANISFYSDSGNSFVGNGFAQGFSGGGTEIIAVPENETFLYAVALLAGVVVQYLRRRAKRKSRGIFDVSHAGVLGVLFPFRVWIAGRKRHPKSRWVSVGANQ